MTAAEDAARVRDGHYCQRCGRSILNYPSSLQHRQPRGMGGGSKERYDRVENLVRMCGSGTTDCHGWVESHRKEGYDCGFLVHRWDLPAEIPLVRLDGTRFFLTDEGSIVEIGHV